MESINEENLVFQGCEAGCIDWVRYAVHGTMRTNRICDMVLFKTSFHRVALPLLALDPIAQIAALLLVPRLLPEGACGVRPEQDCQRRQRNMSDSASNNGHGRGFGGAIVTL